MQKALFLFLTGALLGACSSESDPASSATTQDAGSSDDAQATNNSDAEATTEAGTEGGATYVEPTCALTNDTGGPGQYNDSCVQRSWIKDYVGSYSSAMCELTIAIDGSAAATFTMKVLSGAQAGTYTIDWEGGGSGAGNDSYYRFTTDTTFATTKTLNFNAGQATGTGMDERNTSLRVEGIDTATIVYKGSYSQTISGMTDDVDCGEMMKK